jgi:hypothetical protein
MKKIVASDKWFNFIGVDERSGIKSLLQYGSLVEVRKWSLFRAICICQGRIVGDLGKLVVEKVGANVRSSQSLVKDQDGDLGGEGESPVKKPTKGEPPRHRYAILANKVDIVNFTNSESALVHFTNGDAGHRDSGVNKPVSVVPFNIHSPRDSSIGKRNSTLGLSGRSIAKVSAPEPIDQALADKCMNPPAIPLESQGPNNARRGTAGFNQSQPRRASVPNVEIDIDELKGFPKSSPNKTRIGTQDTGAFKKTYQTDSGFCGFGQSAESRSVATSTRIEFQTMENFNYYVVGNHFAKTLTNCIKDVGTELYISIEFDVKKYVARSMKNIQAQTPEIAEKDFGIFVGDLVKYLGKKFKYYKANYVYDNFEKQEDLTPLDMCKIVFGLEDEIIEPLKNPDFFLETTGVKFRSLWEDDKKFQEFLELLLTEWSNNDKFHDSTLKKWFKYITTDKTEEKMMNKLFLLIAYLKAGMQKVEYDDYIPRIISALIRARNWALIGEWDQNFLQNILLNHKRTNHFLTVNLIKRFNEIIEFTIGMKKKIRITVDISKKKADPADSLALAPPNRAPFRRVTKVVPNMESENRYFTGMYGLTVLLTGPNVDLVQKELVDPGAMTDFTWWELLKVLSEVESDAGANGDAREVKQWFAVLRAYIVGYQMRIKRILGNECSQYGCIGKMGKLLLKELVCLARYLKDKRATARVFSAVKDWFFKTNDVCKKQIDVLVRMIECTPKLDLEDFINIVVIKNYNLEKKNENWIITEGVRSVIHCLLSKKETATDLKIKAMLGENSEYKNELYNPLSQDKQLWNLILFYFQDRAYDNLTFRERLLSMSRYTGEEGLIRQAKNVSSKEIDEDLLVLLCTRLGDKPLKAFLEEKYLAKQAFADKAKLEFLFVQILTNKRTGLVFWLLEKLLMHNKKNRDKFEQSFSELMGGKVSSLRGTFGSAETAADGDITVYEFLVASNRNFYFRFRKFWDGMCGAPRVSEFNAELEVNSKGYEGFCLALTVPGIRPATQKAEKTVSDDKRSEFYDAQDKLYLCESSPLLFEEYQRLFTDKYPKLDPLVLEFIKANKHWTYMPTNDAQLKSLVEAGSILLNFEAEDSVMRPLQRILSQHRQKLGFLVQLSLLKVGSQEMSITPSGLRWLAHSTKSEDELWEITIGNEKLSVDDKVKLAIMMCKDLSSYLRESKTPRDQQEFPLYDTAFEKFLVCMILIFFEKEDEFLDILLISVKKSQFKYMTIRQEEQLAAQKTPAEIIEDNLDLEYQDFSANLADVINLGALLRYYAEITDFSSLINRLLPKVIRLSGKFAVHEQMSISKLERNSSLQMPGSETDFSWMAGIKW